MEAKAYPSALVYAAQANGVDPGNPAYKAILDKALSNSLLYDRAGLRTIITAYLGDDRTSPNNMQSTWRAMILVDPVFKNLKKLMKCKTYSSFRKRFLNSDVQSVLCDPFVLHGIRRLRVNFMFELLVMHLRRLLLESLGGNKDLALLREERFIPLRAAIACSAFNSEYIYDASADEMQNINRIETHLEQADTNSILTLASYKPLYRLHNSAFFSARLSAHGPLAALVANMQIDEPLQELRIKQDIQTVTPIKDAVSLDVQTQYEEFPYPRWQTTALHASLPDEIRSIIPANPQVLIAGCGTGLEAIETALSMPDAHILAVDLSRSSLSYGMRKAQEMNVKNITFRQGDIMELGSLNQTFDVVSSVGVLHHLKDPGAGWRIITGLLKPGGAMRIGLYSETARRKIVEIQKLASHYSSDENGIKRFRADMKRFKNRKYRLALNSYQDFFSMSECRDLFFHVMENRFDIPSIQSILEKLNLSFLLFYFKNKTTQKAFKDTFPEVSEADLQKWNEFEQKNPDTFIAMYQFWCRKAG
jgi:ubiquinone/menaquinone biosynthesis C-methylase UbiE